MNRGLLGYYERELQHVRGMANEFAREFPKIAGRLTLEEFECADPYVERLFEGFAYLTARVQMKFDAEFPRLTQSILSTVYPHFLSPTPSMAVVQFQPNLQEADLSQGFRIKRGEPLRSIIGRGDRTACEYRTAQPVTLWPLRIVGVDYFIRELAALDLPPALKPKAGIRIRLEVPPGRKFSDLKLDSLPFFIRGTGEQPVRLYEQIFGHASQVVVQPVQKPVAWHEVLPPERLRRVGFEDDEALLPVGVRSFQGYRLLHEYFAFPERFLFFEVSGLQRAISRCTDNRLDIMILTNQGDLELENRLDAGNLALFCTPMINLFPKEADRIHLEDRFSEFHVIPDRTRPKDFEVYQITDVAGYRAQAGEEQRFRPFYASNDFDASSETGGAYYTVNRVPRVVSSQEKLKGRRSNYVDSEVFLALVDARALPYRADLRQLGVRTLCTNRDLPLMIPLNQASTDFTMQTTACVASIRCLAGPTAPRPAFMEGELAWRAISHLSLNYLSLVDTPGGEGAAALRDLLKLYADPHDHQTRKQIEGVSVVASQPVTRRIVSNGPIAFARGLEVAVTLEDKEFEGVGVFLLGAVLERFFAKYVSINSFTETVIRTKRRGEIMRWPARLGIRQVL